MYQDLINPKPQETIDEVIKDLFTDWTGYTMDQNRFHSGFDFVVKTHGGDYNFTIFDNELGDIREAIKRKLGMK